MKEQSKFQRNFQKP